MKKSMLALILAPLALAKAQEITGNVNSVVANNYLVNGFSFNKEPTLFLKGSATAKIEGSDVTLLGIHSRDIKNHFNGKTSWIEYTGLLDASRNIGFGTASVGAYHTFLPADVFDGVDGVNGVYGSFKTNTNPSAKIYADRGFKFINGTIGKASVSGSANVLDMPMNAGVELGAMSNYFIKKKGLHYLAFDLNSDIITDGPLKVSAGLKYQMGIGDKAITGLQGKLTASHDF